MAGCWRTTACAGCCTRGRQGSKYRMHGKASQRIFSYCAKRSRSLERFPPQQPIRRKRWFEQLLAVCARLRATRTTGKHNKRMVKRRNSPYASHDRAAPRHVPMDCAVVMLEALPVTVRKRGKSI